MRILRQLSLAGLVIALIWGMTTIALCQASKPEDVPSTMIVVHWKYDYRPGIDKKAYAEFAKKSIATFLKAPGFIEFRANRNLLGSPQARATGVWRSAVDWAKFGQSPEWKAIETQLRTFATNIEVEMWGIGPLLPKPVRPKK